MNLNNNIPRNFRKYVIEQASNHVDLSVYYFDKIAKEFNAIYYFDRNGNIDIIEFENEEDFLYFTLRFG